MSWQAEAAGSHRGSQADTASSNTHYTVYSSIFIPGVVNKILNVKKITSDCANAGILLTAFYDL